MFIIVVHHYCVNSGLLDLIDAGNLTPNTFILQYMGMGGKVGVNIFFIITGFFMVTQRLKIIKVAKLIAEIIFYNVIITTILLIAGYHFSLMELINKVVLFVSSFNQSFISAWIAVYILSPVVNKWLMILSKREYTYLLTVLIFIQSVLSLHPSNDLWNYFLWGLTMYMTGGYIRRFEIFKIRAPWWAIAVGVSVLLLGTMIYLDIHANDIKNAYYFQKNAHMLPMFVMGFAFFIAFRRLKMPYIPWVNKAGASAFGVLLIHANSSAMRQWLWHDTLDNVGIFTSPWFIAHMLLSCVAIYVVCTIIDMARIRWIERPLFEACSRRWKWLSKSY